MMRLGKFKQLVVVLLALTLITFNPIKAAEIGKYVQDADTLQALGLFKGTSKGYELTKNSTRAEAAVMLVRLLGVEQLALDANGLYQHPFLDVPTWAQPHIAYLYAKGLTNGTSATTFGATSNVTANQYTTMLLRSLGYSDEEGLYQWDQALNFAGNIGLIDGEEFSQLKPMANKSLIRDEMTRLSYKCLFTNKSDTQTTLLKTLLDDKIISRDKLQAAIQIDTQLKPFLQETSIPADTSEMRAVWLTYIELQGLLRHATPEKFQEAIRATFEKDKELGLNTVIVQVRPFGDALYASNYYPWSYVISGKEGVDPGFDPLQIMIAEAHDLGLNIEAWINPFRIRSPRATTALSSDNPALKWLKDGSNRVIQLPDTGMIYNPASQDARDLITNGVKEIVTNYDIDGIHFDDYFYPSVSLTYDATDYAVYKKAGGLLTQPEWRRENVNILVKEVYSAVKSLKPQVLFGISPQGSFEGNFEQQFIDTSRWLSSSEYIDYICPQIYYGYEHSKYPFVETIAQWDAAITSDTIKLYIGLSPYKIGREDVYAGTSGRFEWINSKNIIQSMILDSRKMSHYSGFMLYRHEFLFDQKGGFKLRMDEEIEALKSILEINKTME